MNRDWTLRAACRGYDPTHWFPEDAPDRATARADTQAAKAICWRCPVRGTCLVDALATDLAIAYGIRGGLTGAERADFRDRAPTPVRAA